MGGMLSFACVLFGGGHTALHALLCALAIDLWWGEPPAPLHPVVWMGRALGACGARLAPARATGRDLWSFWLAALIWCALAAIVLFLAAALQWLAWAYLPAWGVALVLGLLSCMVMGLVLVWSNIERMDTTYFINIQQNTVRERRALRAKLEVERERLLSPYELRRKADEFGMREPKPGQIRRMEIQ